MAEEYDQTINFEQERILPHEFKGEKREQWENALWTAFLKVAYKGFVNASQLEELAEELRVEGDRVHLLRPQKEGVPKEDDLYSFEEAVAGLDKMSGMTFDEYADIDVEHHTDTSVVYLGVCGYIWYNLCCGSKQPGVTYVFKKPDVLDIKPKKLLLMSTGVIMLVIGLSVILTVSLQWLTQAVSREKVLLHNFHSATLTFSTQYENTYVDEHAAELVDQARTYGSFVKSMANLQYNATITHANLMARKMGAAMSYLAASEVAIVNAMSIARLEVMTQFVLLRGEGNKDALLQWLLASLQRLTADDASLNIAALDMSKDGADGVLFPSTGQSTYHRTSCRAKLMEYPANSVEPQVQSLTVGPNGHISTMMYQRLPRSTFGLCEWVDVSTSVTAAEAAMVSVVNDVQTKVRHIDYHLLDFPSSAIKSNIECRAFDWSNRCAGFVDWLSNLPANQGEQGRINNGSDLAGNNVVFGRLPGTFEESFMAIAQIEAFPTFGVLAQQSVDSVQEHMRLVLVESLDHLNWNFVRSTELVFARYNRTSGEIIRQATSYRFEFDPPPGCYEHCYRSDPSSVNIKAAFEKKDHGFSITPDYRPEPVMGGYMWIGAGIDMAFVIERDVLEVRGLALDSLISIMNIVNAEALTDGSLEVELVRYKGMLPIRVYNSKAPCPEGTDCRVAGDFNVIFRYNCRHCQSLQAVDFSEHEHLTLFKKSAACSRFPGGTCDTSTDFTRSEFYSDVIRRCTDVNLLDLPGDTLSFVDESSGVDYVGTDVLTVSSCLTNWTAALVVKVDQSDVLDPITENIAISIGSAVSFVVFGMALLLVSSSRALDRIEADWAAYKQQIETEKQKFGELVRDVIPPNVAERMMNGQKVIADVLSSVCIVFVDVCDFTNSTKGWTPRQVIRLTTYYNMMLEAVATHCDLFKLTSVGDTYGVAGVNDQAKASNEGKAKPDHVRRGMNFAAIVSLLCSPAYSHYPHNVRTLREVFKDLARSNTKYELPPIRVGAHCGASVAGLVHCGGAPRFDCYGTTAALAMRMQATSHPGRIHVTVMLKEMLQQRDPENAYHFEPPRKTVVRGQGTITSYFVASAVQEVPLSILPQLGIQHAARSFDFDRHRRQNHDRRGSSMSDSKSHATSKSMELSGAET